LSGLIKAVSVAVVCGILCFSGLQQASAQEDPAEDGPDRSSVQREEEIPLYIIQLQDYQEKESEEYPPVRILQHTIETGDTLFDIAERYGTNVETLVNLNGIRNPHLIFPGDSIDVLTGIGLVHNVEDGDTVKAIAELYEVEPEVIIAANRLAENTENLSRGERIIVPGARLPQGVALHSMELTWPLQGRITSGFGWRGGSFHYGIDIAALSGTPIYAAESGRVIYAGYRGSYGLLIELQHNEQWSTRYAHASKLAVGQGQQVHRGDVLAYVGSTGNSTGPHLHFEIICNGERIDPLHYLP
jgi:murein DD-endopeptidase MepM/ murein hydrolase activator NlpD